MSVTIQVGDRFATFDFNGWTSDDTELEAMLRAATETIHYSPADGRRDVYVADQVIKKFLLGARIVKIVPKTLPNRVC